MLKPGDTFGDYRVVRLLGQGGMGAVYLLEDAEGVEVAAKILDPATSGDHEARKRFVREAQLALGVRHPHVVETYDVGEDPETGLDFILMEYVPGGSLSDRLEKGPIGVGEALRITDQIAAALELAQEKQVVHRDIKPANIMFGADGAAKLADLGIARCVAPGVDATTVTQTGMMIGTPAYMSPEQMLDSHRVDQRADIYSLGVVLYEMLAGKRPNADDTPVQLMAKAVAGEPIPDVRKTRPDVPASVARLVDFMCAMNVGERLKTAGEVRTAIRQIVRGEAVTVMRRRRPARRRHRPRAAILAALGLSLAALAAAFALRPTGRLASIPGPEEVAAPVGLAATPVDLADCGVCIDVSRGSIIWSRDEFCRMFRAGDGRGTGDFRICPFGVDDQALASARLLLLFGSSTKCEYSERELAAINAFLDRGGTALAFLCRCNAAQMESLLGSYGVHVRELPQGQTIVPSEVVLGAAPIAGTPYAGAVPEDNANGAAWRSLAVSSGAPSRSVLGIRAVGNGRLVYASEQMLSTPRPRENAGWWSRFLPLCLSETFVAAGGTDDRTVVDRAEVGLNVGDLDVLSSARLEPQAKAMADLLGRLQVRRSGGAHGVLLVDSSAPQDGEAEGLLAVGAHYDGFPARQDGMSRLVEKLFAKKKKEN